MADYQYYLFQAVPLDEGGYVLHYVAKYKTWDRMYAQAQVLGDRAWVYIPILGEWLKVSASMYWPAPIYPVLRTRVPAEIRHVISK